MALTRCQDCSAEVSSDVSACPKCGKDFAALKAAEDSRAAMTWKLGGIALNFLGMIVIVVEVAAGTGTSLGALMFWLGVFAFFVGRNI